MTDTPPRPPRRWLRAALLAVGVLAVARLALPVDVPADVLQLPPAGAVRAAQLVDGTPVFLVHPDDARVEVVEAFATGDVGPVGALVGWCPSVQQFVAPHHGLRWDAVGVRLPDTLAGRLPEGAGTPARAGDLVRRGFERLDGRGDAEDPLRVAGPLGEDVAAPVPPLEGSRTFSPPATCRVLPEPLPTGEEVLSSSARAPHLLDHAFQASLLRLPRERWQVTDGWILVDPDGTVTWCRVPPTGMPPTCPNPAPVPLSLGIASAQTGGAWAALGGPLAARVAEGAVVEVAVLPRSRWRGSSLQGAHAYTGERARLDAAGSAVVLHPTPRDSGPECLPPPVRRPGAAIDPPVRQAVDADTLLVVDGRHDPGAFADALGPARGREAADPEGGADVEVLVDAATCRALRMTVVAPG